MKYSRGEVLQLCAMQLRTRLREQEQLSCAKTLNLLAMQLHSRLKEAERSA